MDIVRKYLIPDIANIVEDYASPDYRASFNRCIREMDIYGITIKLYLHGDYVDDYWEENSPMPWGESYDAVVRALDMDADNRYNQMVYNLKVLYMARCDGDNTEENASQINNLVSKISNYLM